MANIIMLSIALGQHAQNIPEIPRAAALCLQSAELTPLDPGIDPT